MDRRRRQADDGLTSCSCVCSDRLPPRSSLLLPSSAGLFTHAGWKRKAVCWLTGIRSIQIFQPQRLKKPPAPLSLPPRRFRGDVVVADGRPRPQADYCFWYYINSHVNSNIIIWSVCSAALSDFSFVTPTAKHFEGLVRHAIGHLCFTDVAACPGFLYTVSMSRGKCRLSVHKWVEDSGPDLLKL